MGISWVCKGGRRIRLTTLPPSRSDSLGTLGASTSNSPQGLSRPVHGQLHLNDNICSCQRHGRRIGGLEVHTHAFLSLAVKGCGWSTSRPGRFNPGKRWYPLNIRLRGLLFLREKFFILPGFEPRIVGQSLCHAIPARLVAEEELFKHGSRTPNPSSDAMILGRNGRVPIPLSPTAPESEYKQ